MGNKNVFQDIRNIKLGGFFFNLRFVKEDKGIESASSAGISTRRQEIAVIEKLTEGESILHECMHGIDWQILGGAGERPEDYIHRFSYALYAFMRDNPGLIIRILRENNEEQVDRLMLQLIERSANKYPEEDSAKTDKEPA